MKRQVDFALGHGGRARLTLFLSGPKGSGKTIFVEWFADELRAPVDYFDLRSQFINDSVIRDACARNRLRHSPPVLFHLDEFQAPLEQWLSGEKAKDCSVTIQGLQSLLEGISAPNTAVFIFNSSQALPMLHDVKSEQVKHELQGLLRRFQCVVAIPPLDRDTALAFLQHFLEGYIRLPDWDTFCDSCLMKDFVATWRSWGPDVDVPFDMLSKYMEQAVRDFYVKTCAPGVVTRGNSKALLSQDSAGKDKEMQAVLRPASVTAFFKEYAGGSYLSRFVS